MTQIITVPFGNNDRDLLEFLKKRSETPDGYNLSGVAIRDALYELKKRREHD